MSRRTEWKRRLLRESGACHYCGKQIECWDDATLDHVLPLSRGGADAWHNVVLACRPCNDRKGNATGVESPKQPPKIKLTEAELMDLDW